MLLVGHEDFVAGLHVDAVSDVVISFSGVSEECDFVALAADEGGERIAELVKRAVSPDGVVFGIGLVELLAFFVAFKNGAEDGRGAGADGAVVEIDLVGGDEELLAEFAPVGFFVAIEEGRVGELGREGFELGPEVSAPEGGRSEADACGQG